VARPQLAGGDGDTAARRWPLPHRAGIAPRAGPAVHQRLVKTAFSGGKLTCWANAIGRAYGS